MHLHGSGVESPSGLSVQTSEVFDVAGSDTAYFPLFDWLRFALACTVMFVHYGLFEFWPPAGIFAVHIFFALSGWLIGGILLNLQAEDLPRFYFNRSMRIWVPYYMGLTFLVIASGLHDRAAFSPKWWEFVTYKATFVWNLFGTQQLATYSKAMPLSGVGNHFWSVNAEEQFYLLAPLLLVLYVPKVGRRLTVWILISMLAYFTALYASIAFGVLAAVMNRIYRDFFRAASTQLTLLLVIVVCSYLFILQADMSLVAPWCAISVVLLLARSGCPTKLGRTLGGLSYQLYLNHWIGLYVAGALLIPLNMRGSSIKAPLGIALSLILAYFLYRFIDTPLLAARSRIFKKVRPKVAMWAGYTIVLTGIVMGFVLTKS